MESVKQERLLASLPVELRDLSVDLSDEGSAEYAFPLDRSMSVFSALLESGHTIIGGDLWRSEHDGFHACGLGWYTSSEPDSAPRLWNEFVSRAPSGPEFYVTFVVK